MYPAARERGLDFDMLRKKDLCPIKYARVCKDTGEEVPYKDIVKGYEYRKGEYVVISDEDFRRADMRKVQTIEILNFVRESEIDSRYIEKPYYLEPIKESREAYALLREALEISGKVGIARFVLRTREHLGFIKADGPVIVFEQLRFDSDVIKPDQLDLPGREVPQRELDMAIKFINQITEPFHPEQYRDTYTDELRRVIAEKIKGKVPATKGERPIPTGIADLMSKLRESLEEAQRKR